MSSSYLADYYRTLAQGRGTQQALTTTRPQALTPEILERYESAMSRGAGGTQATTTALASSTPSVETASATQPALTTQTATQTSGALSPLSLDALGGGGVSGADASGYSGPSGLAGSYAGSQIASGMASGAIMGGAKGAALGTVAQPGLGTLLGGLTGAASGALTGLVSSSVSQIGQALLGLFGIGSYASLASVDLSTLSSILENFGIDPESVGIAADTGELGMRGDSIATYGYNPDGSLTSLSYTGAEGNSFSGLNFGWGGGAGALGGGAGSGGGVGGLTGAGDLGGDSSGASV